MSYEVKLDVFEGPVDLLLHLITRRRVDIYEVSLSTITEEYLGAIRRMDRLDLESTTGFLVVAATLLELKAARLLPDREFDETDARLLDERDVLLGRLVECATYREAGSWLAARLAQGDLFVGRAAGLEPAFADLAPDPLENARLEDLLEAAEAVFAPRPTPVLDVSHVAPIKASVRDAILDLAGMLRSVGVSSFSGLCRPGMPRIEVIVRFLALLELVKAGAIEVTQGDRFGEIIARWRRDVDEEELAESADEYAADPEGGS